MQEDSNVDNILFQVFIFFIIIQSLLMNLNEHGGNIYDAAKELNVGINKIIDLSSNVLPFNILDDLLSKYILDKRRFLTY